MRERWRPGGCALPFTLIVFRGVAGRSFSTPDRLFERFFPKSSLAVDLLLSFRVAVDLAGGGGGVRVSPMLTRPSAGSGRGNEKVKQDNVNKSQPTHGNDMIINT